jgi:sugar lactone lactonase YvrE
MIPTRRTTPPLALAAVVALTALTACDVGGGDAGRETAQAVAASSAATPPTWTWAPDMVFPTDTSLARPEDGVALPDGRLIVTDQVHGLRMVATDGSSAPFGDMVKAGYVHAPPKRAGGANGVSLEPDGKHLLVTDGHEGAIYRVNVESGAAGRVYQHRYGVNSAVRDSRGAIWFTHSTRNTPEEGEARMWAAVDKPMADGALLRLASVDGVLAREAEVVVDSLLFANGVAIDEPAGMLYVAETIGARVLRYRVDLATGRVSERTVFAEVGADNLELDGKGHLWVAAPLDNMLVALNTTTGARHVAFQLQSEAQKAQISEFVRRGESGTSRMELMTPALWAPLPGFVTGVIIGPAGRPVYLTGLGNALVRLP